ncbi:corepressor complex crc230, partial [Cystoisospora suis]
MGGRTGCPEFYQAANDMWSLHLASDTWSQVQLEGSRIRPPPRFGCAAVWSDDILLTLFGGETTASNTMNTNSSGAIGSSTGHAINGQTTSSAGGGREGGRSRDPAYRRLLLDDMWHFKIVDVITNHHTKGAHVVGEWIQEKFEGTIAPRSHYAAIFITQ